LSTFAELEPQSAPGGLEISRQTVLAVNQCTKQGKKKKKTYLASFPRLAESRTRVVALFREAVARQFAPSAQQFHPILPHSKENLVMNLFHKQLAFYLRIN
jgi:hypothetical protein